MNSKSFSLSGFDLKIIAVITMIIDHAGAFLFPQAKILRIIGRISFPIFAFLICEGYEHTKDVKKYMLRLLLFAVISEPFFDLAMSGTIFSLNNGQNVIFTLLIGVVTIYFCERNGTWIWSMIGMVAGDFIAGDYGAFGVMLIMMLWYQRKEKWQLVTSVSTFAVGISLFSVIDLMKTGLTLTGMLNSMIQLFCVLACIPLFAYNKERGGKGVNPFVAKYLFYIFYPLQFFVFYLINSVS